MAPKLSILVPVYNVEEFLPQALSSLVDQSLSDLEIICINDGSTDGSLAIMQRFARKDSRISIIDKPNTGYGDSMNLGLKRAKGDHIGILEPDDWIEPDAFQTMYAAAVKHKADVVKANYYRCRTDPKTKLTLNQKVTEITTEEILTPRDARQVFQFAPAIWSAIYRREFLRQQKINFLPTPGASYQDLSFSFKVWTLTLRYCL